MTLTSEIDKLNETRIFSRLRMSIKVGQTNCNGSSNGSTYSSSFSIEVNKIGNPCQINPMPFVDHSRTTSLCKGKINSANI